MLAVARRFLVIGVVALLGGCAVGRSVVTLEQPQAVQNPATGAMVRINSVEDARVFEAEPKNPSTPSLGERS